MTLLKI